MRAKLERIAGTPLTLTGTTRTGALELATPGAVDDASPARMAKALREDRAVLWAEPQRAARTSPEVAKLKAARYEQPGRQLLVRFADGVAEDWSTLAPRFAARDRHAGRRRAQGRQRLGAVASRSRSAPDALAELAKALEQDAAVHVRGPGAPHVSAVHVPNDPLFPQQWSLDPRRGHQRAAAWDAAAGIGRA